MDPQIESELMVVMLVWFVEETVFSLMEIKLVNCCYNSIKVFKNHNNKCVFILPERGVISLKLHLKNNSYLLFFKEVFFI